MKSYMIMDGQWGSGGKGVLSGYLALNKRPDSVVCAFGSNAGHTVYYQGNKVMTQQLPSAIISDSVKRIFIGPNAVIDEEIFINEMVRYSTLLRDKELIIHPRACVITQQDKDYEKSKLGHISSTQKGVGSALSKKIMREDVTISTNDNTLYLLKYVVSGEEYFDKIMESSLLQIESAQGFELGINSGISYPYCTSRDITPVQILSDCGLPLIKPEIYVVMRTFPIRVGGTSGPVWEDQRELKWNEGILSGIEPEYTTVTGKERRVFTFSYRNAKRVLKYIDPDHIFLNFCNYTEHYMEIVNNINRMSDAGYIVDYLGFGKNIEDIRRI